MVFLAAARAIIMMKKLIGADLMIFPKRLTAAASALVMLTALCSCKAGPELKLGTGNEGGVYYAFGTELGELESDITVHTTAGSQANLRLMDEGYIDLAIVQSDILSEAVNGVGDFENAPVSSVRAVAGLYDEAMQIIVRADSDIEDLSDLRGKTISVGDVDSGVARNAEYLLASAGISSTAVNRVFMSYRKSADALSDGTIDAFFVIVGVPSDIVSEISDSTDVRILPLDEHALAYMTGLYSGYSAVTIPAGTYRGQTGDITTLGVRAVLIADSRADKEKINRLTQLLLADEALSGGHGAEYASADIPCAFHDGAAEYYTSVGVEVKTGPAECE